MKPTSTTTRPTTPPRTTPTQQTEQNQQTQQATQTNVPASLQESWANSKSYQPGPASLDSVRSGQPLSRGQSGPAVLDLQRKLNAAGMKPPLAEDGLMGPKTEAAVRKFNQANGIGSVGQANNATLQSLDAGGGFSAVSGSSGSNVRAPTEEEKRTTPSGAEKAIDFVRRSIFGSTTGTSSTQAPGRSDRPFDDTRAARETQAEDLLKANGAWPPEEGRTYVVQIDQDAPGAGSSRADRAAHLRDYTGQTAVYRAVGGRLTEVEGPMQSASHPGQFSTNGFTDVNGDGKSDIAHLRSGVYDYRSRPNGSGRFNPTNNRDMSVARDLNQDGTISDSENQIAQRDGHYATGLQWHAGGRTRPSSVGCQTMPPEDFNRFKAAIGEGDGDSFTYLLVRRDNDVHGHNPL